MKTRQGPSAFLGAIALAVVGSSSAEAQQISQPLVRTAQAARIAEPAMQLLSLVKVWQPGDDFR